MSDHWCLHLSAPHVGANLEQMACRHQGTDLPSTGRSLETGTSLLQITIIYLSSLVACPFYDPPRGDIVRERIEANTKQQAETIIGVTFDSFWHCFIFMEFLWSLWRRSCSFSDISILGLFVRFAAFRHPADTDKGLHTPRETRGPLFY